MTVMFLGGLWHGASWNFVIWGILHGVYLTIHKLISDRFPSIANNPFFRSRIGKITSIIIMQYFVFLAWIPFRVSDYHYMEYSIQKYVILDWAFQKTIETISTNKLSIILIIVFFILNFISYKRNLPEIITNLNLKKWFLFLVTIAMLVVYFYDVNPDAFIYYKF
jgi:alginate O-acetyltransferase complex protein AlgI